jgi:uncharacterized protein with HEPN domain
VSRGDARRLDDIRDMCSRVSRLVERGRDAFDQDEALWPALERLIEIAGEASAAVTESTRAEHPAVDWRGLAGTRVILAHAYHRVDRDRLWAIATRDLPLVAEALGPGEGQAAR